jgi:DNA helicase INO80
MAMAATSSALAQPTTQPAAAAAAPGAIVAGVGLDTLAPGQEPPMKKLRVVSTEGDASGSATPAAVAAAAAAAAALVASAAAVGVGFQQQVEPQPTPIVYQFNNTNGSYNAAYGASRPAWDCMNPTTSYLTSAAAATNPVDSHRQKLWVLMARKDIPKAQKAHGMNKKTMLRNVAVVAMTCAKETRKKAIDSKRTAKETHARAKKIMREMLQFWRKYEKEGSSGGGTRVRRDGGGKPGGGGGARDLAAQKRKEAEAIEAKRQARKFDYLVTQTELYAHFLGNKLKGKANGANPADPKQSDILQSLASSSAGLPDTDESALAMQQRAVDEAQAAIARQKTATKSFAEAANKAAGKDGVEDDRDSQEKFDDSFSLANPEMQNEDIKQPAMFKGQLKAYQLKGLNWLVGLWEHGINGILADEMGLGKTVQTIVSLAHLAEKKNIWGPFLVVAPASTLHNWEQEFRKFVPDFKVLPYWGTQQQRRILRRDWTPALLNSRDSPFHVVITSYQMVVSDERHFQRLHWQYMINDEAQALKSSSSVRWQTLLRFKCRNRLLLTGTPIQNSMAELWSLLHFIMPSLFDSHSEFNEWFSKDIEKKAANKAAALDNEQLGRLHMILSPFMLRRIKKDVESELMDKIEIQVDCSLSSRQRAIYDNIVRKISIESLIGASMSSTSDKAVHGELMNLVMQFRKVCNHPDLFKRTVRVFRQKFTLEDAIGSQACSLEANMHVTNGIPLGCSPLLPVDTVNCVQTLKGERCNVRLSLKLPGGTW